MCILYVHIYAELDSVGHKGTRCRSSLRHVVRVSFAHKLVYNTSRCFDLLLLMLVHEFAHHLGLLFAHQCLQQILHAVVAVCCSGLRCVAVSAVLRRRAQLRVPASVHRWRGGTHATRLRVGKEHAEQAIACLVLVLLLLLCFQVHRHVGHLAERH